MITVVPSRTPEDWGEEPNNLFKVGSRWYSNPLPSHNGFRFDEVDDVGRDTDENTYILLTTNKHPSLGMDAGSIQGMWLWTCRPTDRPIEEGRYCTLFGKGSYGCSSPRW